MTIDFHTHAFPDFLAERAITSLAEASNIKPFYDGTEKGLCDKLTGWKIDKAVVLSIATKPTQETSVNNFAMSLLKNERLIPFGSVYPGSETAIEELHRLKEAGIKGIKLHPEYQSFWFGSEKACEIYQVCGELSLIVMFHAGADIGFEPPFHSTPESIAKTVTAFPNTTFIAAHFGSYSLWDDVNKYLCGIPNLYLDTSFTNTVLKVPKETALEIIEKHGYEKILLGSDMPWEETPVSVQGIKSYGLPENIEKAILGENAKKLLKI